ncbi:aldo-keto reductase family protein [Desulfotignum phosphitoxidans]|uniref:Aldo/keto reductase n=1 Tax=Desulfotignum phosphitoxidans DSM 13687 TaxID=1286635 RepID=S0G151_9BACT|nr:aldo/keto reductase [Desulfotignum phosphitoxidans]EMS80640.1 aldo/keto reductase [Desulfotignum phosphitoxidans DSM 13687]
MAELRQTLDRLNTSYLDLWQIHDVRGQKDLDLISEKDGSLEAFLEAKDQGLIQFALSCDIPLAIAGCTLKANASNLKEIQPRFSGDV